MNIQKHNNRIHSGEVGIREQGTRNYQVLRCVENWKLATDRRRYDLVLQLFSDQIDRQTPSFGAAGQRPGNTPDGFRKSGAHFKLGLLRQVQV